MSRFLVTGGAGFIGSHLVMYLVKEGYSVKIIDNLSNGSMSNLSAVIKDIEFVKGDIRDLELCMHHIKGVDFVLHQAALGSVPRSIHNPIMSNESNVVGTLNVFYSSHQNQVRRVVLASSSSVYGEPEKLPTSETSPISPRSPYAVTKATCESFARIFNDLYGLETVCLRYFNVFGPLQNYTSSYSAVIPKFIHAILHGVQLQVYGDGNQSRDFTYVSDVVRANVQACFAEKVVCGNAYNIARGKTSSINTIIEMISHTLNRPATVNYLAPRIGEARHSLANISEAANYLGYIPEVDIEEGLQKTVEWFQEELAHIGK